MSKTDILDELPKLTKTERQEIRLRLAELDGDDWIDDEDPLTLQEKALLDARATSTSNCPSLLCTTTRSFIRREALSDARQL